MFERFEVINPDAILMLMAAYRADADPRKVDLGIGVYRDERGHTPVLEAVRRAEAELIARQDTKGYVGAAGNPGYNREMEQLVLGSGHAALGSGRLKSVQTPGGCGALRLGAELIRLAAPDSLVHVSTPTWANHAPLIAGSGLKLGYYPYFDAATGGVQFGAMMAALERLPPRAVVLLHASCHNPTGADLSADEWRALLELVKRRGLVPFLDMAYQGLGEGVEEDALAVRLFCAELPEVLVAVSCSKNFGLYRERTGSLHVLNDTPKAAEATLSQLVRLARGIWSMPPDHGAEIARLILADATLRAAVAGRDHGDARAHPQAAARGAHGAAAGCPQRDFSFIGTQRGMFSFLGISTEQVRALRSEHHVYMTDDSRINIAGLREENLAYFARAVAQVL